MVIPIFTDEDNVVTEGALRLRSDSAPGLASEPGQPVPGACDMPRDTLLKGSTVMSAITQTVKQIKQIFFNSCPSQTASFKGTQHTLKRAGPVPTPVVSLDTCGFPKGLRPVTPHRRETSRHTQRKNLIWCLTLNKEETGIKNKQKRKAMLSLHKNALY